MKIKFLLGCLFITLLGNTQGPIDILQYKFGIRLNDSNDTIDGTAIVKLVVKESLSSFHLDLVSQNANGKGMKVKNVVSVGKSANAFIFKQDNDKLIIDLKQAVKTGDTLEALINYSGIPADGLIISKNKYGHRTFFSDNWPNRGHNWIPCVDDPGDKASVEFIVTAPSHYQVVSNGVQIEETSLADDKKLTHWKEELPIPTKVMVIGVADFAVNLAGTVDNCIPVSSWVFPENKNEGFYDYAQATGILNWMINYIGPYPYKKLANIQSKTIFGGMENASAIFYFENSVTGKQQQESLLGHEIAHQWFGNTATEKSFAHIWLSEGFATYMTHLYMESRYGTDSLNKRMQIDRNEVILFVKNFSKPVVDNNKNYMQLLNENSYQKGSWVLHMLRRELGDTVFRKAIRTYYATYAGKNADTKDLQKIFEQVSGKNLAIFFDQWLYKPENPKLKITWNYAEKEKLVLLTVEQLQKDVFVLPLDIGIDGLSRAERLTVNKKTETFRIAVKKKPASVIADPNTSLLFESTVQAINRQ